MRATNTIAGLENEAGMLCCNPEEMEWLIYEHFWGIFSTSSPPLEDVREVLSRLQPRVLEEDKERLQLPYSESEVPLGLKGMHPFKSPGPDGMRFLKKFWHIVGLCVLACVMRFLNSGTLPQGMNYMYIVLIPKVQAPRLVSQFRPISLCNVVYRLPSKVVANRVQRVLPAVISETQSAFVLGRYIIDNVLLAYETHHYMLLQGPRGWKLMSIKLDMTKAFHRVEWSFVASHFSTLGFPNTLVSLIRTCISSVSFSFLLNGVSFGELAPECGVQ